MVAQGMYVVIRQGKYPARFRLEATAEFREFQKIHSSQPGYQGTTVAHLGQGRYVTVTAWETEHDMHTARKALQSMADRLLNAHMLEPSDLIGTGPVVYCDSGDNAGHR